MLSSMEITCIITVESDIKQLEKVRKLTTW